MRRREEGRFREHLQNQDKERQEAKGERERRCVSVTMERDEGTRQEISRRKEATLAQVEKGGGGVVKYARREGVGEWEVGG